MATSLIPFGGTTFCADKLVVRRWLGALLPAATALVIGYAAQAAPVQAVNGEAALGSSQAAIGRLVGDYGFTDVLNRTVRLSDFRGRPLVVNMVYTGCSDICPTVSEALARAIDEAQDVFGENRFHVATVGFDARRDTPERMRAYARSHGLDASGWSFLSADGDSAGRLADDLGFLYAVAPQGFDHAAQTTIIDADGRVYRQIYGATFEPPALVEPLKELIWGKPSGWAADLGLVDRIRLICTVYDASSGRYRFSYAIFIGIGLSGLTLCIIGVVIARAWLGTGHTNASASTRTQGTRFLR